MKKLISLFVFFAFTLTFFISCKKNTEEVVSPNEQETKLSNQNLKSWLLQNGDRFKEGKIDANNKSFALKGKSDTKSAQLDWEHPFTYTYNGIQYKSIPFTFSENQKDSTTNKSKFSIVFRNNKDKIEAKVRITTRAANLADSVKNYLQESFYNLNGELSEGWIYINKKGYKINKKYFSKISNVNTSSSAMRYECTTVRINSYTLECIGGYNTVCTYTPITITLNICQVTQQQTQDAYLPEDFGGFGEGGYEYAEYVYDCDGVLNGTATRDPNCGCIGGSTGIASCPNYYNPEQYICSEDGTEDDIISYLLSFEPKWGQLGTKASILLEISSNANLFANYNTQTFQKQLEIQQEGFFVNRMWTPRNGSFIDAPNSVAKDRYIYTANDGWIDMHHFFYTAFLAEKYDPSGAMLATTSAERIQWIARNESAFSYEDLPSNAAGIRFHDQYHTSIKNGSINLIDAVSQLLGNMNPLDPTQAPNFDYIPHILDGNVPTNHTSTGYTGSLLKEKAKEAFCKKTLTRQEGIKIAHKTLPYSSN